MWRHALCVALKDLQDVRLVFLHLCDGAQSVEWRRLLRVLQFGVGAFLQQVARDGETRQLLETRTDQLRRYLQQSKVKCVNAIQYWYRHTLMPVFCIRNHSYFDEKAEIQQ